MTFALFVSKYLFHPMKTALKLETIFKSYKSFLLFKVIIWQCNWVWEDSDLLFYVSETINKCIVTVKFSFCTCPSRYPRLTHHLQLQAGDQIKTLYNFIISKLHTQQGNWLGGTWFSINWRQSKGISSHILLFV